MGTFASFEHFPPNVGIVAEEVYFPRQFVSQEELEKHDGVSTGKYTIGLGQTKMGFCTDVEDINSICLTVVQNLVEKYGIDFKDIGRLEVGTETIIDKAKSVKTVLMQLFEESGNFSVEGIDTTNACYGGTSALFNAVNWVESSSWDGRYALVVAGDIAIYARGSARPTGGSGVVAMLIGPHAPLALERGMRATHCEHSWDFFKPDLSSEYPIVDGPLTVACYLKALDKVYAKFLAKMEKSVGRPLSIDDFDYFAFHSPYTKLVVKSIARLAFNDFLRNPDSPKYETVQQYRGLLLDDTYTNKEVEKSFISLTKTLFAEKVERSLLLARQLGNMYCGTVYGGLASLVYQSSDEELAGKRIVLFSYGSGFAASMFSITVDGSTSSIRDKLCLIERLKSRTQVEPAVFDDVMKLREDTHNQRNYCPVSSVCDSTVFPGTYVLSKVDDKFRRSYKRV